MNGTKRFVNIRGYVTEITVNHQTRNDEWVVTNSFGKTEVVPEHLFYHETQSGLILRDDPEFNRRYQNHPISIPNVPNA